MKRIALIAAVMLSICALIGAAPDAAQPKAADEVRSGDLLIVSIAAALRPDGNFIKPVRVDANGAVPIPYVKEPLKVAGLDLADAEAAIKQALQASRAIDQPNVWIDRMERGEAASVGPGPIAPGDVVRVSLCDLIGPGAEQVRNFHVSESGAVGLPYLGQTKIAGMSEAEAESAIRTAYEKAKVAENVLVCVLRVKLPPGPEPIPTSEISNARVGK